MCDNSDRLIVWLDGELSEGETAVLNRHVDRCATCRQQIATYRRVSGDVKKWCEAVADAEVCGRMFRRPLVVVSALAVAASVVFAFNVLRQTPTESSIVPAPPLATEVLVHASEGSSVNATHRIQESRAHFAKVRKDVRHRQQPSTLSDGPMRWIVAQRAVEIVIPADAMFAPGSVPEGVGFNASLIVAPDGSVQSLTVR